MNGMHMALQLECDCGNLMDWEQPVALPMLREMRYRCKECGTCFLLHLQEVKNPNWAREREVVEL
mgnify:CR=1 FL=1